MGMLIARRLAFMVFVLWGITLVTFFLSRVQWNTLSAPGSPLIMRPKSSYAWCVSVSMVTRSPEDTSTSGLSDLLK